MRVSEEWGTVINYLLGLKLYRGSYMSARVLLNLLNELGKRDKMRGLPSILSLFRNEFNKFNNTRARMLRPCHTTTYGTNVCQRMRNLASALVYAE